MDNLETERLLLIPLTAHQLKLWADDMSALETELGCVYRGEPIEGVFLNIIRGQIPKVEKNEADYLFHSFWFLIRKADRVAVGSASFKDVPNDMGEVEIGYGLGEEFKCQGYMTEAIKAMCDWALAKENISNIIAETDADNIKSQNVLIRCGFKRYKQEKTIWRRL